MTVSFRGLRYYFLSLRRALRVIWWNQSSILGACGKPSTWKPHGTTRRALLCILKLALTFSVLHNSERHLQNQNSLSFLGSFNIFAKMINCVMKKKLTVWISLASSNQMTQELNKINPQGVPLIFFELSFKTYWRVASNLQKKIEIEQIISLTQNSLLLCSGITLWAVEDRQALRVIYVIFKTRFSDFWADPLFFSFGRPGKSASHHLKRAVNRQPW